MAGSVISVLSLDADLGRAGPPRRKAASWRYCDLTLPAISSRSRMAASLHPGWPTKADVPVPEVMSGNTISLEDQTLEIKGLDFLFRSAATSGSRR
jgi:hypothetical protein